MKKNYLTRAERLQFSLPQELKDILVGLSLGDLCIEKRSLNARCIFTQGLIHKEYLLHLYELFKSYGSQVPKILILQPHKLTGKEYGRISFNSYSLPCFNEIHELFYPLGKKIVSLNIG